MSNEIIKVLVTGGNGMVGSCIRDFIHVFDIAKIHFKVLERINKLSVSRTLNCGYNKGVSVLEVANEFKKQGSKYTKIIGTKRRKKDIVKIIASNNRLKNFIDWSPRYNKLSKIVKSCLNWEKKL